MGSSNKIDISRFDPTNASDDQIRIWLFAIIQAELEKDDAEVDQELIDECSDCEAFLSHNNPEITREEYAIGLARIKEKAQATQAESPNVTVQTKPKRRRFMRGAVFILAATLAVTILSVSVVAAFNGSDAWEFILNSINWFWKANPGDTIERKNVTLIKGKTVAEYSSVEEALIAGGFENILYPIILPYEAEIEQIVQSHEGTETEYRLIFILNSDRLSYCAYNYKRHDMEKWNNLETLTINNKTFYIAAIQDSNQYQAACYYNGFEYIITCDNYDSLISILNNMEEVKK